MNLKKDLADMGRYLFTPLPQKYHFVGVDNKRAARNLGIAALVLQVGSVAAFLYGPKVIDNTKEAVSRVTKKLKKH